MRRSSGENDFTFLVGKCLVPPLHTLGNRVVKNCVDLFWVYFKFSSNYSWPCYIFCSVTSRLNRSLFNLYGHDVCKNSKNVRCTRKSWKKTNENSSIFWTSFRMHLFWRISIRDRLASWLRHHFLFISLLFFFFFCRS